MSNSGMCAVEIIAHRGYSDRAPENTTVSMALGWKHAEINELDIHLSVDKRMMVIHDSTTSRTCESDYVVSATAARKIRKLDAGIWKGQEFAGTKIPYLEEILKMLPSGKELFIEIKSGVGTVPILAKAISDSGKRSRLRIITFHYDVAAAAKKRIRGVPVYWLVSLKADANGNKPKSYSRDIVTSAVKAGLDGLNLGYKGVDQDIVDAARKAGLRFYVWTVDDPEEAVRLYRLGVDGITTNDPVLIRNAIRDADSEKSQVVNTTTGTQDQKARSPHGANAKPKKRSAKRR